MCCILFRNFFANDRLRKFWTTCIHLDKFVFLLNIAFFQLNFFYSVPKVLWNLLHVNVDPAFRKLLQTTDIVFLRGDSEFFSKESSFCFQQWIPFFTLDSWKNVLWIPISQIIASWQNIYEKMNLFPGTFKVFFVLWFNSQHLATPQINCF